MSPLRELAYRIDPVLWVREVLGVEPSPWQETFLRAPHGASILVLTARQVGKTTAASWAMAHTALYQEGSLSVIACPRQEQSAEGVRRVKEALTMAGAELTTNNVYRVELANGARVLALPGSEDTVRGLTVDGWIVADEAARVSPELIAALRPMRARKAEARFAMLSTANTRTDPFWNAWESDDPSFIRLKATLDQPGAVPFSNAFLESELHALGEEAFKREYLGIPGGSHLSPFTWDLYARATCHAKPLIAPGIPLDLSPPPGVPLANPFHELAMRRASHELRP